MTIDDIRQFAHSNCDAFLDFLFEDGFGPVAVAEHLERKYAQTLRDQFAIAALPDCLAQDYGNDWGKRGEKHTPLAAMRAYQIADAMMAARKTFSK